MAINSRNIALKIIEEVFNDGKFVNDVLDDYFYMYEINNQDKSFINKIVYGTVEYKIRLDYIINQFSKVKTNKLKKPILNILRLSVYQLLFMENVPDSAVCNEAVKLTKKRKIYKLTGFVNGVLRNIARNINEIKYPSLDERVEYLSVYYSFPNWLVKYLLNQYSYEQVKEIFEESLKSPKLCVRHNHLACTKEQLINSFNNEKINYEEGHILPYAYYLKNYNSINTLKCFNDGWFQVQDESSMLVTEIANPKEEDVVIDLCAAPGGKTTHLAERKNNKGKIYARDISFKKLEKIKENCDRLGITCVEISQYDATVIDESLIEKGDIVIIDVPCSGLGILKKKPDIKYNVSEEGINELISIQKKILNVAKKYVKVGGTLIYSTCTINNNENIKNIEWFINENKNFNIEPIEITIKINNNLNINETLQLLPYNNTTDGFYIAKLRRMS